jgi:ribosome-associated protein
VNCDSKEFQLVSDPQADHPGENAPAAETDSSAASTNPDDMTTTSQAETTITDSSEDSSLSNGLVAARIADDFRANDVLLLDMRPITPITDFFVIVTVTSTRQMKALAAEVDTVMKNRGNEKLGAEGEGDTMWMLRDYGDVVLHVFNQEGRELYGLENLWSDATRVDWHEK